MSMAADTPIYFRSLELKNVRCFARRQRLKFTDNDGKPVQWILILGDNGVGKTTLLQCLAWMRPVPHVNKETEKIDGIEPALNSEENEVWDSLIRMGGKVDVILRATLSAGQKLGAKSGDKAENIETHVEMQGNNGLLQARKIAGPDGIQSLYSDPAIFAYGASRRPGTVKRDEKELSDPLASLYQESTELYDAEDILLKLDHSAKSGEKRDVEILQRVKQVLAAVLPDIENEKEIHIRAPKVFGRRSESGGVQLETPYGPVPLSGLSLGYQTTLTWIVDLALRLYERYPESSNPLAEPGIVLIDNIDLHLHPRWQRRMMADITARFPAIQFVATAHSPLIVQAAENAKLVVLREQEGQVLIDDDHELVNTWRVDQILASDLFGISTRSKHIEELRKERNALLDMPNRSQSDEDRLRSMREELDNLPTAEDSEDRAAMDLIREIANDLRESRSNGS